MAEAGGQPRLTPKGRGTRERIVKTAAELMSQRGVAGTSIADVRKAAEVSGSQMTHYFQDKRSLVLAVISWQADTVIGVHREASEGGLNTFNALDLWAERSIALVREAGVEGGCGFGSLAGELVDADAETRAELAVGFSRWEAMFREGLLTMRDRGVLRPEADPAELAASLLAAFQGGMLLAQTTRDIRHLEAALRTAVAYVRSFAPKGPPRPASRRGARASASAVGVS
jgi:AcrR family transcriptional regulator